MAEGIAVFICCAVNALGAFWTFKFKIFGGAAALAATEAECAAGEAFFQWRLANPTMPVGKSAYAQQLVMVWADAYRTFLLTHPYIRDCGHLAFILALLNESGPPPPAIDAPTPQHPLQGCCFC